MAAATRTTLLWWKWLNIADVVSFLIPDGLVDMLPGSYGTHGPDGDFQPHYKDRLLAFAGGDVYLGAIPCLMAISGIRCSASLLPWRLVSFLAYRLASIWGFSRFFKSFFDPLIELYRPVPPLAWAPLILTIFGIQDDGKIFLLFMVAFAIMVISARTGASGTLSENPGIAFAWCDKQSDSASCNPAERLAGNSDWYPDCNRGLLGHAGGCRDAGRHNRYRFHRKCGAYGVRL